ncbi:PREDICTED: hydroxyproline O-galactosyltransferase GALT4-like [Camelina sativa]|uniref:Hydroxyproline O-galactosyltransferase GALT4-like n=1 Tax=Camelina sativa TaxID=90675 RepID=A0ABM1QDG2_CAMSA|nr:PREDICTED: hydroxyproline O-galactosyltransferase GALT4-like [Camelina sativa]
MYIPLSQVNKHMQGCHVSVDGRHITSFPFQTGFALEDAVEITAQNDTVLSSGSGSVKPIKPKARQQESKSLQRLPARDKKVLAEDEGHSTTVTLHNRFKVLGPVDEDDAT